MSLYGAIDSRHVYKHVATTAEGAANACSFNVNVNDNDDCEFISAMAMAPAGTKRAVTAVAISTGVALITFTALTAGDYVYLCAIPSSEVTP